MTYKEWLIGQSLRRFPKESWYRFQSHKDFNKIIRANYMSPNGIPIDVQAMDMEVDPEEIVDFVLTYLRNPFVRKRKPDYNTFNEEDYENYYKQQN